MLLADDHAVLRDSLAAPWRSTTTRGRGSRGDGVETLAQIAALHPDVVLLTCTCPALAPGSWPRHEHPACRIVVLILYDAP